MDNIGHSNLENLILNDNLNETKTLFNDTLKPVFKANMGLLNLM